MQVILEMDALIELIWMVKEDVMEKTGMNSKVSITTHLTLGVISMKKMIVIMSFLRGFLKQ